MPGHISAEAIAPPVASPSEKLTYLWICASASGGIRTHMPVRAAASKAAVSTNSTTDA